MKLPDITIVSRNAANHSQQIPLLIYCCTANSLYVKHLIDFFQSFLILVLSFLLLPLGWGLVGGMTGIKAAVGDPAYAGTAATCAALVGFGRGADATELS